MRLSKFQALALPQLNVAGRGLRGLIVFQQVPDITTLCNREVPCSTQPKKKAYSRIQLSVQYRNLRESTEIHARPFNFS